VPSWSASVKSGAVSPPASIGQNLAGGGGPRPSRAVENVRETLALELAHVLEPELLHHPLRGAVLDHRERDDLVEPAVEAPGERGGRRLGRQALTPARRGDRPTDLDRRLALDLGPMQADVTDELAGVAIAPPPEAEAVGVELTSVAEDRLAYLGPGARAAEVARPMPPGDRRVAVVGGGEIEMAPDLGRLGVEALGPGCAQPAPSGQKSCCCSVLGCSSRVDMITSSASSPESLWTE
jgi:hypothetical protein